jgi:hypothetical protein
MATSTSAGSTGTHAQSAHVHISSVNWVILGAELTAALAVEREYALAPPPDTHPVACTTCGGPLDARTGAERVVCDHRGRLTDVIRR